MLEIINDDRYYSPEDLARKFKISLSSVYKLVRSGEIPSLRLGKIYRIPESTLSRYIQNQQKKGPRSRDIPVSASTFLSLLGASLRLKNKIHQIYLYGSYARGDFDENSDIDLCLIVDAPDMKDRQTVGRLVEKAMSRHQYRELLSVRVESLEAFERMRKGHYPFVQHILREGEPLWKNH